VKKQSISIKSLGLSNAAGLLRYARDGGLLNFSTIIITAGHSYIAASLFLPALFIFNPDASIMA